MIVKKIILAILFAISSIIGQAQTVGDIRYSVWNGSTWESDIWTGGWVNATSGTSYNLSMSGTPTINGETISIASVENSYLMSGFYSSEDKLRFWTSTTGTNFDAAGAPVWAGENISVSGTSPGMVRDPALLRINDSYYVFHTLGTFGGTTSAQIATSNDLQNWSHYATISTEGLGLVTHAWINGYYIEGDNIYALLSISFGSFETMAMYLSQSTISSGFTSWSTPVAITGPTWPTACIAQKIIKVSGTYNLFYSNFEDMEDHIQTRATSASIGSGYTIAGPLVGVPHNLEGFSVPMTGSGIDVTFSGTYRAYMDKFANGGTFSTESVDLNTWTTPVLCENITGNSSNPGIWVVDTPKMAQDVANLKSRHVSVAGVNAGYKTPTDNRAIDVMHWIGGPNTGGNARIASGYCWLSPYESYQIFVNCYNDGGIWKCIDTSKPAWQTVNGFGSLADAYAIYRGEATSGAISFSQFFGISNTGDVTVNSGNLSISTSGKGIMIKEGSNAKMGTATLVSGTISISTTAVSGSSRIFLSRASPNSSTGIGSLSVTAVSAGTAFTITSLSAAATVTVTDTSIVNWIIFDPSP